MRKIYFEQKYVTIFYNPKNNLGGAVWRGFMNSEEFREAVTQCLNLIEEHHPTQWLADNRGLKAIRQADQEWMLETVVPKLAKSSLQKMASLIPKDIFGQMAVESMYTRANEYFNYENAFFHDEQQALQWLLTDTPYASIRHSDGHDPADEALSRP